MLLSRAGTARAFHDVAGGCAAGDMPFAFAFALATFILAAFAYLIGGCRERQSGLRSQSCLSGLCHHERTDTNP